MLENNLQENKKTIKRLLDLHLFDKRKARYSDLYSLCLGHVNSLFATPMCVLLIGSHIWRCEAFSLQFAEVTKVSVWPCDFEDTLV